MYVTCTILILVLGTCVSHMSCTTCNRQTISGTCNVRVKTPTPPQKRSSILTIQSLSPLNAYCLNGTLHVAPNTPSQYPRAHILCLGSHISRRWDDFWCCCLQDLFTHQRPHHPKNFQTHDTDYFPFSLLYKHFLIFSYSRSSFFI